MKYFIKSDDKRSQELSQLCQLNHEVSNNFDINQYYDIAFLGIHGKEYQNDSINPDTHIYTLIDNTHYHKYPNYYPLYKDFTLVQENTALTSEATIARMIMDNPKGLNHRRVLILGYGNCGKDLSKKLQNFGCEITISNRGNLHQRNIEKTKMKYCRLDDLSLNDYDYIINTIPHHILTKDILDTKKKDAIIYDIASFPYGTKKENQDDHYIILNSLPSKYAYQAAAKHLLLAIEKREEYYVKK